MTTATAYRPDGPLALVATTPDDSHAWNLIGVALKLEELGCRVINLGPCTPEDLLTEEIRKHEPDLVVLSTVNGHGANSILKVLETLMYSQVKHIAPIVAGGLLTTSPDDVDEVMETLQEAGLSGVFQGDKAWDEFEQWMAVTMSPTLN